MWASFGVAPTIVLGHSLGESIAACAAGMIGLEDALRLIATRGRLMQELPQGGEMQVLVADESRVRAVLEPFGGELSIAALQRGGPDDGVRPSGRDAASARGLCARGYQD